MCFKNSLDVRCQDFVFFIVHHLPYTYPVTSTWSVIIVTFITDHISSNKVGQCHLSFVIRLTTDIDCTQCIV